MRPVTLLLVGCVALAASHSLAAPRIQDKNSPDHVNKLIEKLGHIKFAARDRAMTDLEAIGPAALPTLRPALNSTDLETRQRVELLIRKLEDQLLVTKLLTAKRVRVNVKDVTVYHAIGELAKQSGYPVYLASMVRAVDDPRISVDTGETTFWDALSQLCAKAGLVEEDPLQTKLIIYPGKKSTAATIVVNPAMELVSGKSPALPTCFAGTVRIQVIKSTRTPEGHLDLVLEVVSEPSLVNFADSGWMRGIKARDDHGQVLLGALLSTQDPDELLGPNGNNGGGKANIRKGIDWHGIGGREETGFNRFQAVLRLQNVGKNACKVSEVSGGLGVKALIETEPVFVVDKIMNAAGQSFKGKDGSNLKVVNVDKYDKGDFRIHVSVKGLQILKHNPHDGPIRNPVLPNLGAQLGRADIVEGICPLHLLDAKGNRLTHDKWGIHITGLSDWELAVVVRPSAGQGPPTQLVLPGHRLVTCEVPFTFKDIALP